MNRFRWYLVQAGLLGRIDVAAQARRCLDFLAAALVPLPGGSGETLIEAVRALQAGLEVTFESEWLADRWEEWVGELRGWADSQARDASLFATEGQERYLAPLSCLENELLGAVRGRLGCRGVRAFDLGRRVDQLHYPPQVAGYMLRSALRAEGGGYSPVVPGEVRPDPGWAAEVKARLLDLFGTDPIGSVAGRAEPPLVLYLSVLAMFGEVPDEPADARAGDAAGDQGGTTQPAAGGGEGEVGESTPAQEEPQAVEIRGELTADVDSPPAREVGAGERSRPAAPGVAKVQPLTIPLDGSRPLEVEINDRMMTIRFGRHLVNFGTREKPFRLLQMLCRGGGVVPRDELFGHLWDDEEPSVANLGKLYKLLNLIRRVLRPVGLHVASRGKPGYCLRRLPRRKVGAAGSSRRRGSR